MLAGPLGQLQQKARRTSAALLGWKEDYGHDKGNMTSQKQSKAIRLLASPMQVARRLIQYEAGQDG